MQNEKSKELYKKIMNGDLDAFQKRVNAINELAVTKAERLLKKDETAKILIFAGMRHVASGIVKKCDKSSGKPIESKFLLGIDELLKKNNYNGLSINIHDPDLCTDKEDINQIKTSCQSYTRYADGDILITIEKPDFLLLLDTPSNGKKVIKNNFDNLFLPGEHDIATISEKDRRIGILRGQHQPQKIRNINEKSKIEKNANIAQQLGQFGLLLQCKPIRKANKKYSWILDYLNKIGKVIPKDEIVSTKWNLFDSNHDTILMALLTVKNKPIAETIIAALNKANLEARIVFKRDTGDAVIKILLDRNEIDTDQEALILRIKKTMNTLQSDTKINQSPKEKPQTISNHP